MVLEPGTSRRSLGFPQVSRLPGLAVGSECYDLEREDGATILQFDKPPLIELVAELRWIALPPQVNAPLGFPQPMMATSEIETFLSNFAQKSAESGWAASERLVPQGYPMLSYQPVYRVRSFKPEESHMLYQLGAGLYSAHALPPYKNWEAFRPFAERGLGYLLDSRVGDDRNKDFFGVSLKYLDVFTKELVGDLSVGRFLTEILGFSLTIPPVLEEQIAEGRESEPTLAIQIPLKSGLDMRISLIGGAVAGDRKGILMDTSVQSNGNVQADKNAVMAVWEEAHAAIRRTFVGLTTRIHSAMIPIEDSK